MPDVYWLERVLSLETASRVVDALLVGALVAAIVTGWLTGLTPVVIGLLVAGSAVLEELVGLATRRRILDTATRAGHELDGQLRDTVADLADRMAVPTPDVAVDDSLATGITVLQGSDGPVVLVSRTLVEDLDGPALRGVIAHELAHLDGGHIRFDARDPIAHVVGATAFWVVIGQQLSPILSLVGLATYVGAGVFRGSPLPQLYYLCASLGIVLLPLGLIAFAHRLQEHRADDRAVAVTSPEAFCRGLFHVVQSRNGGPVREEPVGARRPSERRGLIARLTATHPPLERRFARYGVAIEELDER